MKNRYDSYFRYNPQSRAQKPPVLQQAKGADRGSKKSLLGLMTLSTSNNCLLKIVGYVSNVPVFCGK